MHHRAVVINTNPTGYALAFLGSGPHVPLPFDPPIHVFSDSAHLNAGISFTNDKKFGGCVGYTAQVQLENALAFDVLDTVNDEVIEFFNREWLCYCVNL